METQSAGVQPQTDSMMNTNMQNQMPMESSMPMQTNSTMPTKRRSPMFAIIVVIVIVLIGLFGVAGLVYAYNSNNNVPLFSGAVERIEKLAVSDKTLAKTVTKQVADNLDTLSNQQNAKNILTDREFVTIGMKLSGKINESSKDTSAQPINTDFSITGNGVVDYKKDNSKFMMNLTSNITYNGVTVNPSMDIGSFGSNATPLVYLKLANLPNLGSGYNQYISQVNGKWIKIDSKQLKDQLGSAFATNTTSTLTPEQINQLKTIIQSDTIVNNFKRVNDLVVGGVRTECFDVSLDNAAVMDLGKQLSTLMSKDTSTTTITPTSNSNLDVYECIGRRDLLPYVVKVSIAGNSLDTVAVKANDQISMEFDFSDYGKSVQVTEPTADVNLLDLIQQIFQGTQTPTIQQPVEKLPTYQYSPSSQSSL